MDPRKLADEGRMAQTLDDFFPNSYRRVEQAYRAETFLDAELLETALDIL
jgi:hypothetical protein